MQQLFKLAEQITPGGVREFQREHSGVIPTKGADLTEYGWAWGMYDPQPEVSDAQIAEQELPVLIGGLVRVGWIVRDKTREELLADLPWKNRDDARIAVVAWVDGITAQILEKYPKAVQARWPVEEAAARAFVDGTADARQASLITEEGTAKGLSAEVHAVSIIANADRFHVIADNINKLLLATDKALSEASSPLEYPAIFAAAQTKAEGLAADFGLEIP